ncbi:MAG: 1-acyl-sn-glycerol-3-phosphate acyltransferase [Magnetococcales bacterium]|nr:1-acyl-sn-glycerol-3-phosphate acyltransferase [Magnetococcales bacterium]
MIIMIRSALFFISFIIGIIFFGLLIVLVWPVTSLHIRQHLSVVWSRFNAHILRLVSGLDLEVHGMENLPPRPYLIVAKHQSAWETVIFPVIFYKCTWVLKQSLGMIPVFGWALKGTGQIFVDRSRGIDAVRKMNSRGREILQSGGVVVVFPEGTRVDPGVVGDYKSGGISLAMSAKVPIVPVAHNAGEFWPRKTFRTKPGAVQVRIGKPLVTEGSNRRKLLAEAKVSIEAMMDEIEHSKSLS